MNSTTITLPLITGQLGIWLAEQLASNHNRFTIAHYCYLDLALDQKRFDRAIRIGLSEADSLHAYYHLDEQGQAVQTLKKGVDAQKVHAPEWLDVTASGESAAHRIMQADVSESRPIDGSQRLYRQLIIKVAQQPERWIWYQRFHHLMLDGFSLQQLTQRIIKIYQQLIQNDNYPPTPFTYSLSCVIDEHQAWQQSSAYQQAKQFWQTVEITRYRSISLSVEKLNEASPVFPLRYCRDYPLISFAAVAKPTLNETDLVMAAIVIYLARLSGETELSIGFPFMRRLGSKALNAAASVVNVLPLPLTINGQQNWLEIATHLQQQIKRCRAHQNYEADWLRADCQRAGSQQTLYGPVLNYQIYQQPLLLQGQEITSIPLVTGPIDDLEFEITRHADKIQVTWLANRNGYSEAMLAWHEKRLRALIETLLQQPEQAIERLPSLLPKEEQQQIYRWGQGPSLSLLPTDHLLSAFYQQVEQQPQSIAIKDKQRQLTYQQLLTQSMQLARWLIEHEIGTGDVVAVALPRSVDCVVALIALLASGATYLPLDLSYPRQRRAWMCEDAKPVAVITLQSLFTELPAFPIYCYLDDKAQQHARQCLNATPIVDDERRVPYHAQQLAYIIYTSGSTGKPKGVMCHHYGLVNLFTSHQQRHFAPLQRQIGQQFHRRAHTVHIASFSFDASWEPLFCLFLGYELYIFDDEQRKEAMQMLDVMQHWPVDYIDLTPSLLIPLSHSGFFELEPLPSLITIGGEATTTALWQQLRAQAKVQVYNYYGPSEYTIDTLGASCAEAQQPIIGQPVANTQVYLLDPLLQPVPIGIVGELYIAGAGLAQGYLNQPALTATRFVANAFDQGKLMYRTGDLMRWLPNGKLAFVGRSDDQIKIRGFRVELGEIEEALLSLAQVEQAIVIADNVGQSYRLLAYCTVTNETFRQSSASTKQLQQALANKLPDYMIPAEITLLKELPLTDNGKVDRQALPKAALSPIKQGRAPKNHQERLLCQAFSEVLTRPIDDVEQDFFLLGGDSISAMSLVAYLHRQGWSLAAKDMFSERVVWLMALKMTPLMQELSLPHHQPSYRLTHLPILQWFQQTQGMHQCFAQGVFIAIPNAFTYQQWQDVIKQLILHHRALAAQLVDDTLVLPSNKTHEGEVYCHLKGVVDTLDATVDEIFYQAVQRLDPEQGGLLDATLLMQEGESIGAVIVIHHFVVDGVSWRILLAELAQLANALLEDQPMMTMTETCSLADWDRLLADSVDQYQKTWPFWREMLQKTTPRLGQRDLCPSDRQVASHMQRQCIKTTQSRSLLEILPVCYQATIEELLLTALAMACQHQFHQNQLRFQLESHGRPDHVELSHTVGWFTAEYPVVVQLPERSAPSVMMVKAIKKGLRAIPDQGVSYGVLRYLATEYSDQLAQLPPAEILFNYLGRFNQTSTYWQPQRIGRCFCDGLAVYHDPQMVLSQGMALNVFVDELGSEPQFVIHWQWLSAIFTDETIASLQLALVESIDRLILFAEQQPQQAAASLVASEVNIDGVNDAVLHCLQQQYGALRAVLPLLPLQQGLLFHSQISQQPGSYNSLCCLSLTTATKEVLAPRLTTALNALIKRYPQLAARFDSHQVAQPLQLIPVFDEQQGYWQIDYYQLDNMSAKQESAMIDQIEREALANDLFQQPQGMLQAILIQHSQLQHYTLILNVHHLLIDGWSTSIVIRDLLHLLNQGSFDRDQGERYIFAVQRLAKRDTVQAKVLWANVLQQAQPTLLCQPSLAPPLIHERRIVIEPEQQQQLLALCQQSGLTLNSVMQGLWALLLSLHTRSWDIIFGSPVSGRFSQVAATEGMVGLFSNTLPVRVKFEQEKSLLEQLITLQQQQIQLIEHDQLSLAELQRLAGHELLFDTLLVVENYPDLSWSSQADQPVHCQGVRHRGYTHYPLTLLVLPSDQIIFQFEYDSKRIDIELIIKRWQYLLTQLFTKLTMPLSHWSFVMPEELALYQSMNQTEYSWDFQPLSYYLAQQIERTPNAIALIDCDHQLTYQQMGQQVQALATLLQHAGIKQGDIVAVALERSVRLTIALHAIVLCGAAWLPLDSRYPDDRLQQMLADAQPVLVISERHFMTRLKHQYGVLLFEQLSTITSTIVPIILASEPEQAAYIMYTSGSTGQPKGVVISQQAIVNRLLWMQASYPLNEADVVLQKTSCSFDVSVWEFFWPLMVGAKLVMAPPEAHRDAEWLTELIRRYQVTTIHFVPSMLASWLDSLDAYSSEAKPLCPSIRQLFCSGEALSYSLVAHYYHYFNAPLHNLYGPTEAAVDVTWHPTSSLVATQQQGHHVPIGKPVWNTQLYILDQQLQPVPIGVAGDLYLAGIQLANNYLNRPDLTAERFVANPFRCGERMYRTGDIARWLAEGYVDYLGRNDTQLKLRGQRIELSDIEYQLLALPSIAQAVVAARNLNEASGNRREESAMDNRQLVAWVVLKAGFNFDSELLQQALSERLPAHMLPVIYIPLTALPLSANGKLDRNALPLPIIKHKERLAQTRQQKCIASLFRELLARETIYLDDDFFVLGGHSLLAMRLVARLRQCLACNITIGQVMMARTVEKISTLLEQNSLEPTDSLIGFTEVLSLRESSGSPLFCFHPASGYAWQYSGLLRYLDGDWPIIGLQSPRPNGVIAACDTFDDMSDRHLETIQAIQPHGPYYLIGYSLGGLLAHAVAAKLQKQGEIIAFLGLLDTYPPEGQDWQRLDDEEEQAEIAQEQRAFIPWEDDPQLRQEKEKIFQQIIANYRDAVTHLSEAITPHYDGEATLFAASKTLPHQMDIQKVWSPWLQRLHIYYQPYEHADILSTEAMVNIGPLLNELLRKQRYRYQLT